MTSHSLVEMVSPHRKEPKLFQPEKTQDRARPRAKCSPREASISVPLPATSQTEARPCSFLAETNTSTTKLEPCFCVLSLSPSSPVSLQGHNAGRLTSLSMIAWHWVLFQAGGGRGLKALQSLKELDFLSPSEHIFQSLEYHRKYMSPLPAANWGFHLLLLGFFCLFV